MYILYISKFKLLPFKHKKKKLFTFHFLQYILLYIIVYEIYRKKY